MPVPIPGLKVRSDNQKVKFLMIFGRPKTAVFLRFRGVPGRAPLATNHAVYTLWTLLMASASSAVRRRNGQAHGLAWAANASVCAP